MTINIAARLWQVISLEGWVEIMYYVQDTHSFWDWIYFVLLIVVSISCRNHNTRPNIDIRYAESHIGNTAIKPGATAQKTA